MSIYASIVEACALASELRKWAETRGLDGLAHVLSVDDMARTRKEAGKNQVLRPSRDEVFISYSRKDKVWLERLHTHLKPYTRGRKITVWDDSHIKPGSKGRSEIEDALGRARVAVMLVTPHFLASDFIADNELPPLLAASESAGLTILWVPISYSSYDETEIGDYQAVIDPVLPLDAMAASAQDATLVKICKAIKEAAS